MNSFKRLTPVVCIAVTVAVGGSAVHADEQTPEAQWTATVTAIAQRDGVTVDEANTRLVNLLVWTDAVNAIAARDGITIEQAAINLARYLRAISNPPASAVPAEGGWHDTAIAAGWQEWQWPKLACIINRESGGNPNARSRTHDSGLTQINDVNVGFLRDRGIISSRYDLFNPLVNLRAAKALYDLSGWSPWAGGRRC